MMYIVDDVFNDAECRELIRIYDFNAGLAEGPVDYVIRPEKFSYQWDKDRAAEAVEKIHDLVEELHGITVKVETVVFGCMKEGLTMHSHADNVKWDGEKYIPNHTPNRVITAVIYLENGLGGETVYPQITVAQKAGRMHTHRCGPDYYHSVNLTKSPRHTFVVWFTKE